ncbi:LysR family transcriptional regulator [Streptomyces sp. NA04227]|uniref:LysR family transcriptional regulator n=1 Tax=Streptomyces sp. NA04227 TaxID=2742136 RepID=UPI001C37C83C|nr:LysR family transcriptional regulator [Streptomyces sp. NA04227]
MLVEVAHAGSIAQAARALAFTPSALSQQLSKLEKEVGTQLLDRGASGVTLTPAGAVLVAHGERVLGELRDAWNAVREVAGAGPQRLSLGAFATAAKELVPGALRALQRRHPQAELTLVDIEPPDGYGLVSSGELDLLVTHRYPGLPAVPHPGLERRPLLQDPLNLVLPEGHPLGARALSRQGIALSALAADTWIAGAEGVPNRSLLNRLARDANLELHVAYESADYHVISALVAAGLGVALVPATALGRTPPSGLVVGSLRGLRPAREISVLHRRTPSVLTREFVGLLEEAAGEAAGAQVPRAAP